MRLGAAAPELPDDLERLNRRAVRLEWLTIVYLLSCVFLLDLVMGSSQAAKAAWFEDAVSLTPPIAFLIASRLRYRAPDDKHPYGYHRVVSIAFLVSAMALVALGGFILYDSVTRLASREHPSIGIVRPFGEPIWLGWLMLPALVWSALPAVFLGRAKLQLARKLHDKVLYADALMNKADWLTGFAAAAGVVGIGLGLWWADGLAACVISFDIVRDGVKHTRIAVGDLMDRRPTQVGSTRDEPLVGRILDELTALDWVASAHVRLREEGRVFFGEALVVPVDDAHLVARVEDAAERLRALDWRIQEIVVSPVRAIEPGGRPADLTRGAPAAGSQPGSDS